MPTESPWLANYQTLSQAGVVQLPARTQLEISGKDRATFLNGFCTQDIKSLKPGQGTEAFITNGQGKILGHGFVFCYEDKLLFDTVPNQAAALIKHLDRYVIREDVKFADRSTERAVLLLLSGSNLEASAFDGPLPTESLAHRTIRLDEIHAEARRVPLTTFPAWEISVVAGDADKCLAWFLKRGMPEASFAAFEAARIEAKCPFYGQDITDKNLPQEVDRNEQAISFKKGCYLGQETVARIDALGHVNRLLRLVQFEGDTMPAPGAELRTAGKVIGEVTSSTWSPKFSTPIALAYVRREHSAPGTVLESAKVVS